MDDQGYTVLAGRYNVYNHVIGRGQAGTVHPAIDTQTGERVAVKVINRVYTEADAARREALRREITVSMRLQHVNIIALKDVQVSELHVCLVLELATGGELFSRVAKQGRMAEDEARGYFSQVVAAVDYCHAQQVCHRDLKLENILLSEQGSGGIKITDFGFSKDFQNDSLPKTKRVGTLAYMAPEVAMEGARDASGKEQSYDGKRADIWACGVILFVLVAGSYPFGDEAREKPVAIYRRIIEAQYSLPQDLSAECQGLLQRILVVDPQQRATLSEIKAHPWFVEQFEQPAAPPAVPEFQWESVIPQGAEAAAAAPAVAAAPVGLADDGGLDADEDRLW